VTALTEQTSLGLKLMNALTPEQFMDSYECMTADFSISAIKIGLIPDLEIAYCIKYILEQLEGVPVVCDPVLNSSSGGESVPDEVRDFIFEELFPLITLLTPNLDELKALTYSSKQIEHTSTLLLRAGLKHCLIKGGHGDSNFSTDYFVSDTFRFYCYHDRLEQTNVRGTGCVLASSIASQLAMQVDLRDAVVLANAYVHRGIRLAQAVGPFHVVHHSTEHVPLEDIPKLCYRSELIGKTFNFPACEQRLGIYPVVDSSDWINKLVNEGIKTIQLRVKEADDEQIKTEVAQAVEYCDDSIAFFVNDYWQHAIEANAYGVHLGQEDLNDAELMHIEKAGLRLGVSTHSYWELARALAVNPSYIALGPVYATNSKQMPWIPQGVEKVATWTKLLEGHYPFVAIGGIDLERAKTLNTTGVGSVAMISAITKAKDYQQVTQELISCWGTYPTRYLMQPYRGN
jgi:hydroxymethylpyrimidine kinase/phosphomethylpyrimidine kinase/thiamine-phosphate diphosphorylase